ncbi:hypothetical protein EV368DRAFT_85366 [Lentinula lateritia]|nr:hypothetical protein EV368DRAFT_85366 [Lentinula lateritia]
MFVLQLAIDSKEGRGVQPDRRAVGRVGEKLDWLMMDAARQRTSPPKMPETGPLELLRKRRRVVDSDEEEEKAEEQGNRGEEEEEEEQELGEERKAPAPKKARSEKGKERAE